MLSDSLVQMARELEVLERQHSERLWAMYTTGLDFGVDEAARKIKEFKKDKSRFALILDAREKSPSLSVCEQRGAQILYLAFKNEHLSEKASHLAEKIQAAETRITGVRNQFRRVLDGKELDLETLSQVMNESPDRELRRRVYETWLPLNRLLFDAGFLDLIDLRKEYASACGAPDFVSLKLEEDELSPDVFHGWREEVSSRRERFRQAWHALVQEFSGGDGQVEGAVQLEGAEPAPWDLGYLRTRMSQMNRAPVDMTQFQKPLGKIFATYGFEMSRLNLTYDIFPRKNKSEGGACFTFQYGKDARILANVANRFASYWVLLHESAHAVHFLGLDPDEALLNRGVSNIISEGFANFFGDRSYSREFIEDVFPAAEVDRAVTQFSRLERVKNLESLSTIGLTLFDQELYRQKLSSLDDVNELWLSIAREIRGVEPLSAEPPWAVTFHHVSHPIYLHSYVLGDVVGAQMKRAFQLRTGAKAEQSPLAFGRFWHDELLKPSGERPVEELCARVFAEGLTLGPYLDECLMGD
jgi:oligoendopeptidase F